MPLSAAREHLPAREPLPCLSSREHPLPPRSRWPPSHYSSRRVLLPHIALAAAADSVVGRMGMGDAKSKAAASGGVWGTVKPFVNGGASSMLATCVIQPIDMVKVRIELGQGSAAHVAKTVLAQEGFGSFYKSIQDQSVLSKSAVGDQVFEVTCMSVPRYPLD